MCEKANQKPGALARISKLTTSSSEEKINQFLYQCTICLLSFHMDVFFEGML